MATPRPLWALASATAVVPAGPALLAIGDDRSNAEVVSAELTDRFAGALDQLHQRWAVEMRKLGADLARAGEQRASALLLARVARLEQEGV
jgi:hypothetical protein